MTTPPTNGEGQWQAWTAAWTASEEPALSERLQRKIARQRRRLVLAAAGEGVLMLALAVLSVVVLAGEGQSWEVVWLATLWGFALLALGFAYWNRRATWRAAGETVSDHLRLSRLRCERQRRTIHFALLLFGAEAIAIVAQLEWFDRLVPEALYLLAGLGAALGIWSLWAQRRLVRELERIDAFERELDEGAQL